MAEYVVKERSYIITDDGFLQVPENWNEQTAEDFSLAEGIEKLTDSHWELINFIRNYYDKFGMAPTLRRLTARTGYTTEQIYELFPSGPGKGLCKVAGLPKPAGCV